MAINSKHRSLTNVFEGEKKKQYNKRSITQKRWFFNIIGGFFFIQSKRNP